MDSQSDLTTVDSYDRPAGTCPQQNSTRKSLTYLEAELTAGRILGPFSPESILIGQINRLGVVSKGHIPGKWH